MLAITRGDLMDRYTIEKRKNIYGVSNDDVLKTLLAEINEHRWSTEDLLDAIDLATANDSIAVLEWQIRADHKLSDEEVGLRAREIRKINARRVAAKNRLDGRKSEFAPAFNIPIEKLNLAIPDVAR